MEAIGATLPGASWQRCRAPAEAVKIQLAGVSSDVTTDSSKAVAVAKR
jgi:hypothetical protein